MQKPTRKTWVIGGIIVIAVLALASKGYSSPMNTSRDILSSSHDYREPAHFTYDASKLPSLGASESDVYRLLGSNVDRRLSYKTTHQKTVNGQSFEFNKIIEYNDTVYKTTQRTDGDVQVTDSLPVESSEVVIFLLDGKVTHFAGFHGTRQSLQEDYAPSADSVNLDEQGKAWPDSMEDIRMYREETGS